MADETHCLYRHFNKKGKLLYVGISANAIARLSQHKGRSQWFTQISRVEIERFPTREDALRAERKAIATEKPAHNSNGVRLTDRMTDIEISKILSCPAPTVYRWRMRIRKISPVVAAKLELITGIPRLAWLYPDEINNPYMPSLGNKTEQEPDPYIPATPDPEQRVAI